MELSTRPDFRTFENALELRESSTITPGSTWLWPKPSQLSRTSKNLNLHNLWMHFTTTNGRGPTACPCLAKETKLSWTMLFRTTFNREAVVPACHEKLTDVGLYLNGDQACFRTQAFTHLWRPNFQIFGC